MNQKLPLVLLVLFLSACGTHSARGDLPASDLRALAAAVSKDLRPRMLPNGKEYCAELARTEQQQDDCMGDLEDALYASNRDKERAASTLLSGVARIEWARNPCRWWQFRCRSQRKPTNGN